MNEARCYFPAQFHSDRLSDPPRRRCAQCDRRKEAIANCLTSNIPYSKTAFDQRREPASRCRLKRPRDRSTSDPAGPCCCSAPTAEMIAGPGEDRPGSPKGVRRQVKALRYTRYAASRFASSWRTVIILIMALIGTARAGTLLASRTRCCLIFAGGRRLSGGRRRAFASGAAELATRSNFPALRRAQRNHCVKTAGPLNPSVGPKRVIAAARAATDIPNNTLFPRFALTLLPSQTQARCWRSSCPDLAWSV